MLPSCGWPVGSTAVAAGETLYWEAAAKAHIKRKEIGWKEDVQKPGKKSNHPTAAKSKAKAKADSMVVEI